MPRTEERVSPETEQLLRYFDREMGPAEAAAFRARLAESPALAEQLDQLRQVGAAVRQWSRDAEDRAGALLEPTLRRVGRAERRRSRQALVGYVLAALVLVALPWSRRAPQLSTPPAPTIAAPGAAIERVEATDRHAQVFVLGSSSTPVLWLADEALDDAEQSAQDPG